MNTLRITRWIEVVAFSRKPTVVLCNHRNKHSKFFFYVFFSSEGLLVEWRLLVPQTTKQALFFQNPPFFRPQRLAANTVKERNCLYNTSLVTLSRNYFSWLTQYTYFCVCFFFKKNIEWDLGWMPRPLCPVWGGHYSHRGGGEIERSGCHDGNGMALQEASAWPGAKLSATSFSNSKPLHHL